MYSTMLNDASVESAPARMRIIPAEHLSFPGPHGDGFCTLAYPCIKHSQCENLPLEKLFAAVRPPKRR